MNEIEEYGDVVSDYLLYGNVYTLPSSDRVGVHVIPYGSIFIGLESRMNHPNRYLGWFYVTKSSKPMRGWRYIGEWEEGKHLFQNETDFRGESNGQPGGGEAEEAEEATQEGAGAVGT